MFTIEVYSWRNDNYYFLEGEIIKETFETAISTRDFATIIKLREKVLSVTGIKNQSGNDQDFIRTLLKDYNYYTQNM